MRIALIDKIIVQFLNVHRARMQTADRAAILIASHDGGGISFRQHFVRIFFSASVYRKLSAM